KGMTTASISNTTVNQFQTVSVQALQGGWEIVAGLDFADAWGTNSGANNYDVAGSVSAASITTGTSATIGHSTLTGNSNGSSGVTVDAYDHTQIGIGAGAIAIHGGQAQGGGGGGLSLTLALIGDPSNGDAAYAGVTDSTITAFDSLDIAAQNADEVILAGLMADNVGKSNGGGGALIVDVINPTTAAFLGNDAGVTVPYISIGGPVSVTASGL